MLKIGETFDVNLDVRLDDHTPLGYWITVTAQNAKAFFEHFGDKNFITNGTKSLYGKSYSINHSCHHMIEA